MHKLVHAWSYDRISPRSNIVHQACAFFFVNMYHPLHTETCVILDLIRVKAVSDSA